MWCRFVPVPVAGRVGRKGDKVTGNPKVPQPARRRRGVALIEVNTNRKYMEWCLKNNFVYAADKK